jgi:FHS family L-fucose permease-like MFS transporter
VRGVTAPAAPDPVARTLFRLSIGIFFLGGFLTVLVSMIVPRLTLTLSLDYAQALLVQFAFHLSYLLFAVPITRAIVRLGYMRSIVAGLTVMLAGCLALTAAASAGSFAGVLLALLTLSSGITFLQIAANTVVTVIGPSRQAAARLTLLQGFNSLGTVIAPLIGAQAMLRSAAIAGQPALGAITLPFLIGAAGLGALALAYARRRDLLAGVAGDAVALPPGRLTSVLADRRLLGGVTAIFAYVGAEVTIGTLLANYLMLPTTLGASPLHAGRLVTLYWGGAMVGRFAGAALLRRFRSPVLLMVAAGGATLLSLIGAGAAGPVGAAALIAVGLCNAIMYPTIYALALPADPARAPIGSMLLCMAVVGGALVPMLTGIAADRIGLAPALALPALCYAAIVAFALSCRRDAPLNTAA